MHFRYVLVAGATGEKIFAYKHPSSWAIQSQDITRKAKVCLGHSENISTKRYSEKSAKHSH